MNSIAQYIIVVFLTLFSSMSLAQKTALPLGQKMIVLGEKAEKLEKSHEIYEATHAAPENPKDSPVRDAVIDALVGLQIWNVVPAFARQAVLPSIAAKMMLNERERILSKSFTEEEIALAQADLTNPFAGGNELQLVTAVPSRLVDSIADFVTPFFGNAYGAEGLTDDNAQKVGQWAIASAQKIHAKILETPGRLKDTYLEWTKEIGSARGVAQSWYHEWAMANIITAGIRPMPTKDLEDRAAYRSRVQQEILEDTAEKAHMDAMLEGKSYKEAEEAYLNVINDGKDFRLNHEAYGPPIPKQDPLSEHRSNVQQEILEDTAEKAHMDAMLKGKRYKEAEEAYLNVVNEGKVWFSYGKSEEEVKLAFNAFPEIVLSSSLQIKGEDSDLSALGLQLFRFRQTKGFDPKHLEAFNLDLFAEAYGNLRAQIIELRSQMQSRGDYAEKIDIMRKLTTASEHLTRLMVAHRDYQTHFHGNRLNPEWLKHRNEQISAHRNQIVDERADFERWVIAARSQDTYQATNLLAAIQSEFAKQGYVVDIAGGSEGMPSQFTEPQPSMQPLGEGMTDMDHLGCEGMRQQEALTQQIINPRGPLRIYISAAAAQCQQEFLGIAWDKSGNPFRK